MAVETSKRSSDANIELLPVVVVVVQYLVATTARLLSTVSVAGT